MDFRNPLPKQTRVAWADVSVILIKRSDPFLERKPVKLVPQSNKELEKEKELLEDSLWTQLKDQMASEWFKIKENKNFYLLIVVLILIVVLLYFFYGVYLDFVVG